MKNNLFRPQRWVTLASVLALLLGTGFARADDGLGFRTALTLGSWMGTFWQEGLGRKSSLDIKPALGLEFQLGFSAGPVFVQWAPIWLWVQKLDFGSSDKSSDASYFALGSLDAGFHVPPVPVDLYAGIDKGTLGFTSGTQAGFTGYGIKLGSAVYFGPPKHARLGIRLEARKHFLGEDDQGPIPSAILTRAYSFFLGLTIGYI